MGSALRNTAAPLYLFACLILGGSDEAIWQNAVLKLVGIAIIAWSAAASRQTPPGSRARLLLLLLAAAIVIVALQLVPVPPSIWEQGARSRLADGYEILGLPLPWRPLSLTPYASLAALLGIIPPLALYCSMVRLNAYRLRWLAAALIGGALAGILLRAIQLASTAGSSFWYPYATTSAGPGVSFFANVSHLAILLVVCLPFLFALAMNRRSEEAGRQAARILGLACGGLVLIAGIVLNGSIAGAMLLLPVLAAGGAFVFPRKSLARQGSALLAILAVVGAILILATANTGATNMGRQAAISVQPREAVMETTGKAIIDYLPLGSGLGSFAKVYSLYESPDQVSKERVAHAHDDYAEVALELGVPGVLLILLFLAWWLEAAFAVWLRDEGGPFAHAATIASAAILVDSLVDSPLRTAAIGACLAMCLALLSERRQRQLVELEPLRPARHVVFS